MYVSVLYANSTYLWIVKMVINQSCLTLCDPMVCSPPGSSVHGILQARTHSREWVAIPFFETDQFLVNFMKRKSLFEIFKNHEITVDRKAGGRSRS